MSKHSAFERSQRAQERARVAEIEQAWQASVPSEVAAGFRAKVQAARERGPAVRPPDMAPGTAPNPPRPGREPKPKPERQARRRS